MGKESNQRDICAPGRRVFIDAMQRRKHPRLKISALFCVLDIQMNAGDLVSRQVRLEDIHARLVADAGYGSAEMVGWLVDERGIEPDRKSVV